MLECADLLKKCLMNTLLQDHLVRACLSLEFMLPKKGSEVTIFLISRDFGTKLELRYLIMDDRRILIPETFRSSLVRDGGTVGYLLRHLSSSNISPLLILDTPLPLMVEEQYEWVSSSQRILVLSEK